MSINLNVAPSTSCFKVFNLRQSKALKSSAWIILILLSLFVILARSNAQSEIVFSISPKTQAVDEGEIFNVTIQLENIPSSPGAAGFEIILEWDPAILTGLNMTEVIFHSVTPESEWDNIWKLKHEVNDTAGFMHYAYLFQDTDRAISGGYAPITGNHTLAIITFKGITKGQSAISFVTLKVTDPQAEPIPSVGVGGLFLVGNPVPVITVISPKNVTYNTLSVNLTVELNKPVVWIGYSLDEGANATAGQDLTVSEGQHSLVVYANDSAGQMGASDKLYFSVDVTAPTASFTYSPPTPQAELVFGSFRWKFLFNASASYGHLSRIATYFWDFGDGTNATGMAVTHEYRDSGTYNVTLKVTNDAGSNGTETKTLTLSPASEPLNVSWRLIVAIAIPIVWIPLIWFYVVRTKRKKRKA